MTLYRDIFFTTEDGLTLHARDYDGASDPRTPILCLPGLTRNAKDFIGVAERLAPRHRVIVAEQRGRGRSDHDPNPQNYQPLTYAQDMIRLLDSLALPKVTVIGTSLGGLMAMIMGVGSPDRIAGILFNDIGPVISAEGIAKIRTYLGKLPAVSDWREAAHYVRQMFAASFPRYDDSDWDKMTRAIFVENQDGVPVLDYDPDIAVNFNAGPDELPPFWQVFDALPPIPLAVVRGKLSSILSAETLATMIDHRPQMLVLELDHVGHAPTLDESEAAAFIDRFLAGIPD